MTNLWRGKAMKRKNVLLQAAVLTVMTTASTLLAAEYTEIQDNAFEGVNDASYVGGSFHWSADDNDGSNPASQLLTLIEDTGTVPGFTGNVVLDIQTNFVDFNSTLQGPARAYFTGGALSLTFDYWDGVSVDGNNDPIISSHQLSGPISQASVRVTSVEDGQSSLTAIINFDTNLGVENLPSSNNWPAIGESTAVALTFALNADLSAYMTDASAWLQDIATTTVFDSQVSMYPNEQPIPEPTGLLMLVAGSIPFIYRRRA
jgi:hypothetical protein